MQLPRYWGFVSVSFVCCIFPGCKYVHEHRACQSQAGLHCQWLSNLTVQHVRPDCLWQLLPAVHLVGLPTCPPILILYTCLEAFSTGCLVLLRRSCMAVRALSTRFWSTCRHLYVIVLLILIEPMHGVCSTSGVHGGGCFEPRCTAKHSLSRPACS